MKALGKVVRKKKKETPRLSDIPEDEHKFSKAVPQSKKATFKQKELVHPPSSKKSASSKQVFISFSRSDDSQDEEDNKQWKATIKQKELVHPPSGKKSASSKQVSISFSRSDDSQDGEDNERRKATIKQKELVHPPSGKKSASSKQVSISFSRSDVSQDEEDNEEVKELTDLDKLYLAMAEVKMENYFNTLCYSLDITSLSALKDYNSPGKIRMGYGEMDIIKERISSRHFDFKQLSKKYKRSNVVETCAKKGIRVIQKQDVSVIRSLVWGTYASLVCEGVWNNNGVEEKVCLRYGTNGHQLLLHEAEMATLLRHENILTLQGVIIASSYSPCVALVVEFAEYGNFDESSSLFCVERLCRFTIQAATALEHLEKNKVIHQAINPFTCLVVAKNQMKLAGFGACRLESEMKEKPPVSYTQKDVVFNFATLFSGFFNRYVDTVTLENDVALNIKSHDAYGPFCPSHFCDVFDRCLLLNPDERPSFSEIRQSLVAEKHPLNVRVTRSFQAESAEFLCCKTGELITLISKDRHRRDKAAWLGEMQDRKIGFFKSEFVEEILDYDNMDDSTIPLEIRVRGPRAEAAFQTALQNGKVKVYRGRIMLLGQDRAGKTSLKKSLLGMPFNPKEESTVGVEVDPSKCHVDVGQVKNWEPTERKKLEVTEFVEDIAKLIARDMNESAAEQENVPSAAPPLEQKNSHQVDAGSANNSEVSATVPETTPNENYDSGAEIDRTSDNVSESSGHTHQVIQLNIDTTEVLPEDVTDLVLQYLQNLKLEDDIKAKEVILTLWDFAGQHLYYASHSVFLSARAVYVLVYNLNKTLNAEAEPCVRQGIHDIVLDNPNSETNLDNLMSWLVSVHSIRRPKADEAGRDIDSQGVNMRYLRPPVFIVGTNADQPCEDVKKIENCIKRSISGKTYEKHVIRPFFAVDNTKSQEDDGVQDLQKRIMEVLKEEPYMGEEVPLRWFKFEKVVEALVARQIYYMDLDQLLKVIIQECRIDDEDELTAMLNFYHDLGVIVKHGRTVVLQAQWLIDLFKQLITVKPFDELNPLYSDCWHDLEESGVLGMALVDHVFADFVQKGLHKQDILDMMELYGLIAKFFCSSAESEQEQTYFVPSQLRSSPSGLCEIKPSETDPCPLYLHFLDGFVPHGLFPQLLSRCIGWCSEQGLTQAPQLFNNGARLFMGMQIIFDLILICRKRFIKVILKRNLASAKPLSIAASVKMAGEVRAFIEATLQGLARDLSWLHNLRYELCVACSHCLQSSGQNTKQRSSCQTDDDCLHLLRVPAEALICPKSFCDETIKVHGLDKWFSVHSSEIEEQKVELLAAEGVPAPFDQPVSPKSGKPSSDDLLLVAVELGTSWKMLGRALGLPEPVLEQIEEDERNLLDKCFSVLRKWTEAFGTAATYPSLARALRHRIVGRPKLAAKYCGVCKDTSGEEVTSSIPCQTSDTSNLSFPVFLSYQWDLQDTVKTLKNKIEARGIQCWMDIGEMGGGDALFSKIDAGIRACKVFVCCVTEKYIQSDMCQREATLADRLKKPIIPLLFEEISWPPEGQLSLIFARLLYIRKSDTGSTIYDSELDQLMNEVQQLMENPKSV